MSSSSLGENAFKCQRSEEGPSSLSPLVPTKHHLSITACIPSPYLYDHSLPIFQWNLFQRDNSPRHNHLNLVSWTWNLVLKWPLHSPDHNPIEHLWYLVKQEIHIIDVKLTNLQRLCDVIILIWTKICEEFSNTLLNLAETCWKNEGSTEEKRVSNLVPERCT